MQLKGIACPKSQDEDHPDVKEEQRKTKFARMQKGRVLEERQMASHDRAIWAMEQSLEFGGHPTRKGEPLEFCSLVPLEDLSDHGAGK